LGVGLVWRAAQLGSLKQGHPTDQPSNPPELPVSLFNSYLALVLPDASAVGTLIA